MNLAQLQERSSNACELCAATGALNIYEVPPVVNNIPDREIYICNKCLAQIEKKEELDSTHWQCLTTSMWSEIPAVQVVSWRMLNRLRNESWAADNIEMMYFDDATMEWAKATGDHENDMSVDLHKDANGNILENGDTVVLTKSLDVKGSTVNARLGTVVKNIRLDTNDTNYVEGKIEGQSIMIKTIYVRKQGA
ncbi:PhnA domain-containing protein [Chitinophaga sp. 30R24]|uniref:PhnA domain-containing protein n=1 Tax=Chitinophaga sp. 30R24 TaxID=3248838 RepID=UPI003B8FAC31